MVDVCWTCQIVAMDLWLVFLNTIILHLMMNNYIHVTLSTLGNETKFVADRKISLHKFKIKCKI